MQQPARSFVVAHVASRGAANHLDPDQFLIVVLSELMSPRQGFLSPIVLGSQELDPTDLAPPRRSESARLDALSERGAFVKCGGAFLVSSPSSVDQCAPKRDERSG